MDAERSVSCGQRAVVVAWLMLLVVCAVVLAVGGRAGAQRGRRLRAQVYLTQAQIPANLTEQRLLAFGRRGNARVLRESTEADITQRQWTANMVLAFNAPLGDLEFHALFYDVEDGPRRFVEDMSTFVSDRSQKTFVQRVRLPRPKFRPNRRYEMVVTVSRNEVATVRFGLAGEEVRRTGEVNFNDEETRSEQ